MKTGPTLWSSPVENRTYTVGYAVGYTVGATVGVAGFAGMQKLPGTGVSAGLTGGTPE